MNEHLSSELLIDYAHGELRAEDDAFVHAHVRVCSACRSELDAEVAFAESLRAQAHREELEFPGALRGAIWAAVEAERPPLAARIAAFFRPALAMPLAAAALALIVIAMPFGHGSSGTHVDASYYLEAHAAQQMENPFTDRSGAALESAMLDASPNSADGAASAPADAVAQNDDASAGQAMTSRSSAKKREIPIAALVESASGTLADASFSSVPDIVR